jgi:peptidyl-prolyl cis-trans isomerase D
MISWIQRTFQRHFKLVFAFLLFAMAVPLIVIFNPSSGFGRSDRKVVSRPFFGLNLASQEDQLRLRGDANLSVSLQLGSMDLEESQLMDYALQRRASLYLADQLHVPTPSDTELATFMKTLRAFAGEDGQFDPKRYANFRDSLKANSRLSEATVGRVLKDDWRARQVQKLLGGPGYVLPVDVKQQVARADATWTVAVATADYASFDPGLKPTEAELTKFFDENSFRYEIAPRVSAGFVAFPSVNYVGQITVTDDEVKAYYDANPGRFLNPAAAKQPKDAKPDPAADFAAVRAQVSTSLRLERAQRLAMKAASDFSFALYEGKVTAGPALDAALASRKLALEPLAPFTQESGPAELGGSPELAEEAFKLGKDRFFSDAIGVPAGAVVLFWKDTLPSRKPLFAEVHAKVSADYIESEKSRRFVEVGKTLRAQVENRLKAGEPFDKAVAAAAGSTIKVETKTFTPFTLRQPPTDLDNSALGTLEHLDKGQVSDLVSAKDKGYLVYAVDKKLPDFSDTNPQYATTKAQLAAYSARLDASSVLSELVAQELKKTEPATQ